MQEQLPVAVPVERFDRRLCVIQPGFEILAVDHRTKPSLDALLVLDLPRNLLDLVITEAGRDQSGDSPDHIAKLVFGLPCLIEQAAFDHVLHCLDGFIHEIRVLKKSSRIGAAASQRVLKNGLLCSVSDRAPDGTPFSIRVTARE